MSGRRFGVDHLGAGWGAGWLASPMRCNSSTAKKAVVVDVCSDAEFAAGHVVGAKHVPLETLATLPGLVKRDDPADFGVWCRHGRNGRWRWPNSWVMKPRDCWRVACALGVRRTCPLKKLIFP